MQTVTQPAATIWRKLEIHHLYRQRRLLLLQQWYDDASMQSSEDGEVIDDDNVARSACSHARIAAVTHPSFSVSLLSVLVLPDQSPTPCSIIFLQKRWHLASRASLPEVPDEREYDLPVIMLTKEYVNAFKSTYIHCVRKKSNPCVLFYNSGKWRRILTKFCINNAASNCKQTAKFH